MVAEKMWETEKGLEAIAKFCRSSNGVPVICGPLTAPSAETAPYLYAAFQELKMRK